MLTMKRQTMRVYTMFKAGPWPEIACAKVATIMIPSSTPSTPVALRSARATRLVSSLTHPFTSKGIRKPTKEELSDQIPYRSGHFETCRLPLRERR